MTDDLNVVAPEDEPNAPLIDPADLPEVTDVEPVDTGPASRDT